MFRRHNLPMVVDFGTHLETMVADVEVYSDDQLVRLVDQDGEVIGTMCEPMYVRPMVEEILSNEFGSRVKLAK